MIVGGLCVSDQCSKGPDARKIFCAVGGCYAVAFEYVKRRIVNIFAVLFVDSQVHCAKIPAKTNNVPRKPMKVDERSSSNVDRSGGSGGFRQICYSRALRSQRKCSRVVSYYEYVTYRLVMTTAMRRERVFASRMSCFDGHTLEELSA